MNLGGRKLEIHTEFWWGSLLESKLLVSLRWSWEDVEMYFRSTYCSYRYLNAS